MSKIALSISLVKEGVPDESVIKNAGTTHCSIENIGVLYFKDSNQKQARKIMDFFGAKYPEGQNGEPVPNLYTANVQAVLVVKRQIDNVLRTFLVTFGFGRNLINADCIQEKFGMLVVLNSIAPETVRSVDVNILESVPMHDRMQSSKLSKINTFNLNSERDLLRVVTGNTQAAYKSRLGDSVTGSDTLKVSIDVTIDDLPNRLDEIYHIYQQTSYKDNFSFIDLDYKYCVIDEAQDFDNGILRKLTVIAQKEDVKVTIFYDKNQLVIKDELPEIINEFDCKLTLKNNCRNTLHILEVCNNSIGLPPNPSHLSATGTMPELHYSPDTNKIKDAIANKIKELKKSGYGLDDITILTMTTEEKSLLAGDYSIAGYKILDKNGQSGIHFTTARKFKGLESNCVIIVDFNIKQINDQGYKLLFYVATSRAKQNLDVFAVADSNVIDESTSDMDGPFSSTIKMANRLKMKITEI